MPILEVQNIEKHFGKTSVLKNISFTMEKGDSIAVIGSSGSGKTTLLRCLNFLERPSGGRIVVDGEVLFDASDSMTQREKEIRKKRLHFGLVFQSFNLFPQYTAKKNVMLACELLSKDKDSPFQASQDEIEANAAGLLVRMGLGSKLDFYPSQLSGGQQQRVAIARALAAKPDIILADEPTGNLDSKTSLEVMSLLKMSVKKYGQTLIMITHDEELAQMADRILLIEDGRVIDDSGKAVS